MTKFDMIFPSIHIPYVKLSRNMQNFNEYNYPSTDTSPTSKENIAEKIIIE